MTGGTPEQSEQAMVRHALGIGDHVNVEYDDDGWDSRVYLVNRGEAVFKFPRSPAAIAQYQREVRTLDVLQSIDSPVLIPRVQWRGPDLEWLGYRGIVGQQLSYALPELDASTKRSIGRSLGLFLRELHALRIDGLPVVSVDGEIAQYQKKYGLALPALEALTADERAVAQSFFCDVLPNQLRTFGGELRVTHGDLGPWNVILRDDGQVGVIDFGDVSYTDPSRDFSGFGDDIIFESALAAYDADDWLREKAWLRIKAFPILDIPFYLGKGDKKGIQICLDLVRRLIVQGEVSAARPLHTSQTNS